MPSNVEGSARIRETLSAFPGRVRAIQARRLLARRAPFQQLFPDSSKTTLRRMLQSDRMRVNGVPERDAKRSITSEDRVEVVSKSARPIAESFLNAHFGARPEEPRIHHVHRLDRDTSGVKNRSPTRSRGRMTAPACVPPT